MSAQYINMRLALSSAPLLTLYTPHQVQSSFTFLDHVLYMSSPVQSIVKYHAEKFGYMSIFRRFVIPTWEIRQNRVE